MSETQDHQDFQALIERSSLGTEGARRLRDRTPQSKARLIERIIGARELLAACREEQDKPGALKALASLAAAYHELGRDRDALALAPDSADTFYRRPTALSRAWDLAALATIWWALGRPHEAGIFYRETLLSCRAAGDRRGAASVLAALTSVRQALGRPPGSQSYMVVSKVIGIGGGGVNAVNRMIEEGLEGVEFIAIDTDAQALQMSVANVKLAVGHELTRGAGGGANPEVGAKAAEDYREEIAEAIAGADMVFIVAGEGGGTGTGGAPVVASVARSVGAVTIGVVTRPFGFEGKRRAGQAELGIERLLGEVDTLVVIPNDRLLPPTDHANVLDTFKASDQVLLSRVRSIIDLITTRGPLNLDFPLVKLMLCGAGSALMGIGSARGDNRAVKATEMAISSPLLEASIDGARGVLLSIQGGPDLGTSEINEVMQLISSLAAPEANIILGTVIDDTAGDEMRVTVIAAGFNKAGNKYARPAQATTVTNQQLAMAPDDLAGDLVIPVNVNLPG